VEFVTNLHVGKKEVQEHGGIGGSLAIELIKKLPHIRVGRAGNGFRCLASRADVEAFFAKARAEKLDVVNFIRTTPEFEFRAWMNAEGKVAA
jgi:hypothetical protein